MPPDIKPSDLNDVSMTQGVGAALDWLAREREILPEEDAPSTPTDADDDPFDPEDIEDLDQGDVPPREWLLADYAEPPGIPSLGGVIYLASEETATEVCSDDQGALTWLQEPGWTLHRRGKDGALERTEIAGGHCEVRPRDVIVFGAGGLTRPAVEMTVDDEAGESGFCVVETDCQLDGVADGDIALIPYVRLFAGRKEEARIKYPEIVTPVTEGMLRVPIRLTSSICTWRLYFTVHEKATIHLGPARVLRQ